MTHDEIRRTVLELLRRIAPESDPASLSPDVDFREALDLDSMDFLHFVLGLHEALKVDIAEAEYRDLSTVAGCVAKLAAKLAAGGEAPRA